MRLELSEAEAAWLKGQVEKDLQETRVELHHAVNLDFKAELQGREQMLHGLLQRLGTGAG